MSDVDKHSDALPEGQSVLSMRDLRVSFKTAAGLVRAVRGVSLEVPRGKTVAIVGESGSGKSITVKQIMGIHAHGEVHESGQALFSYEDEKDGPTTVDVLKLSSKELSRRLLGRHLAMVFQDPMTSLDPTMTIGRQLEEGMVQHQRVTRDEARRKRRGAARPCGHHRARGAPEGLPASALRRHAPARGHRHRPVEQPRPVWCATSPPPPWT